MALENNQTLRVNLIANTAGMAAGLSTASQQLQAFSNKARVIGRNLTTSLTLPMALVGGAAIKSALSFDKSMTKIKTLVGVASSEVDSMRGTVKRMAADTGVGANDAADALFFITSAGLRGSDALKVLEASSKASAIGLGEVKTVADAVTSAVNAYGMENLSAEGATDVLTAAVREGKLEADSLAQSMGKVLPVSSQLGVRFDEVGAALAAMSRTGTDAAMASTSLRAILNGLMNPTSQANEQLEEYGLSAQSLREQLKEKGLLSVLKTLTDSFGDNQEAAGKVFGNVRALTGVLDLMGKNVGDTEEIFARMTDTTGTTQKGFEELQNSLEFKFRKTWNKLKTSFTELGQTLALKLFPAIEKTISFFTTLINKFNNLDTSTQNLVLTLAGIAAALGPALLVLGTLGTALTTLLNPISLVIVGIAGIGYAFDNLVMPLDRFLLNAKAMFDKINEYARQTGRLILWGLTAGLGDSLDEILTETKIAIQDINTRLQNDLGQLDAGSVTDKMIKLLLDLKKKFTAAGETLGTEVKNGIERNLSRGVILIDASEIITIDTDKMIADLKKKASQLRAQIALMSEDTEEEFGGTAQAMQAVLNSFANQIAKAFENGTGSLRDFALGVLGILGDLLIQAGSFAIMSSKVMKAAFTSMGIAAGIAAIALGGMLKGITAKAQNKGANPMAAGGLVFGPTHALIGEYPGARSNPEVVAPLNKLKNYIGGRSGNENMMVGEFTLRGQDLVVALQRAERNRNRFK